MKDSAVELKMRILEDLEFEIMIAVKSGNQNLMPGLERALSIVEEIN